MAKMISAADGKEVIVVDGKEYLLEKPLRADVSLISGSIVDGNGNIFYKGTTRNFNPVMAMAADIVIVAAEEIVPTGDIQPENGLLGMGSSEEVRQLTEAPLTICDSLKTF